jgi:hypothetical protein
MGDEVVLDVEADPLAVAGALDEVIDALLVEQDRFGGAEIMADTARQVGHT